MLEWLQEWGWALGVAWLAALVLFWPNRTRARFEEEIDLHRVTVRLLRRLARLRLSVEPEDPGEYSTRAEIASMETEAALVDFINGWVRALPRAQQASVERALKRAHQELRGDLQDQVAQEAGQLLKSYFNTRNRR